MDFLEMAVQLAGKLGLVSAELVGGVFFLFGGYKLYQGTTDPLTPWVPFFTWQAS